MYIININIINIINNSYDTWVSSTDVVDEPQEEPVHQGPWEVR